MCRKKEEKRWIFCSKLIKNGGIVKIFSDTLGEISELVPLIKKEAERLPYNVLKADCFLYSDGLSSTTIKNIFKNNIKS